MYLNTGLRISAFTRDPAFIRRFTVVIKEGPNKLFNTNKFLAKIKTYKRQ